MSNWEQLTHVRGPIGMTTGEQAPKAPAIKQAKLF